MAKPTPPAMHAAMRRAIAVTEALVGTPASAQRIVKLRRASECRAIEALRILV
jgi:hypothetical protein